METKILAPMMKPMAMGAMVPKPPSFGQQTQLLPQYFNTPI